MHGWMSGEWLKDEVEVKVIHEEQVEGRWMDIRVMMDGWRVSEKNE